MSTGEHSEIYCDVSEGCYPPGLAVGGVIGGSFRTTAPLPLHLRAGGFSFSIFPEDNQPLFALKMALEMASVQGAKCLKFAGGLGEGREGVGCNGPMRGSIGRRIRIGQGDIL